MRIAILVAIGLSVPTAVLGGEQPTVEPAAVAQRTIVVTADAAPVLVAPVDGAPEAGQLHRGDRALSEAEVNGESTSGSFRWHLITLETDPYLVRGFIHSSLVIEEP